ncbi:unnamed protein product [Prunus armeniaca]
MGMRNPANSPINLREKLEKRGYRVKSSKGWRRMHQKEEKIRDLKAKPGQKENPSSINKWIFFERRRDDEVESESDWGLSSQQLEMGDFYPIALSHLV